MPDLIQLAIPFFVILLLLEVFLSAWMHKDTYETKDTFSSLAMGIGNVITGIVGKALVFGVFSLVYQYRIFSIDMNFWGFWVLLFFLEDLSYYAMHRSSHEIRWFWASHVVHHSSERYNLSTALRQTWTGNFSGTFIFWLWLPLLGFPPYAIMTMQSLSLIYQFWIHTELIDRMPKWFEAIFNTPSHHRVHHGSDTLYLDRNHAGVLIIWDKLFGTFQAEIHPPTYGLTQNIHTFNPVKIAFHEWRTMIWDIVHYPKYAFKYLTKPPGWRHDGSGKTSQDLQKEQQI